MAGTITFGGIGSGMNIEGIITGLVNANKTTLNALQNKSATLRQAAATVTSIGTALSNLQTATDALSSIQEVASFTASSSNTGAIVASAAGNAQQGSYDIQVNALAVEQRTYSASFASNSDALGQTGTLTIGVAGTTANIDVAPGDSLAGIATKINDAGLRMSASVFYDGSAYRLQVRGLNTGAANALTFPETGTALDMNGTGGSPTRARRCRPRATRRSPSTASRSHGRPTRSGIVPGVTLEVAQTTTSPVAVTIASDPTALSNKITSVVNAYNSVINAIHSAAGYGDTKAQNQTLAGDSALRTVAQNMASTMSAAQLGQGVVATLGQLGLEQTRDGTLQFDSTKLDDRADADPTSVEKLLGRAQGATTGGAMANLSDLLKNMTDSVNGVITLRAKTFTDQASKLDDQATEEQTRLNDYSDQLRAEFTAMDSAVAANNNLIAQLQKM